MSGPSTNTCSKGKQVQVESPTDIAPGSFQASPSPTVESPSESSESEEEPTAMSEPTRLTREVSVASTATTALVDLPIKLGTPPKFTGTPDSLANLIFYCNIEFTIKLLTYSKDSKKVIYLISHLGLASNNTAFTWAYTMYKKRDACLSDFNKFCKQLEGFYGDAEEYSVAEAENKLEKLKQTKACAEYAATFDQLMATLGFNNQAKLTLFKRGLKPQIWTALARLNKTLNHYQDL